MSYIVLQGRTITLTVEWYDYPGGPPAAVTGVTVKIVKVADGSTVIGPTSTGVIQLATGLDSYTWAVPAGIDSGDYAVVWSGTDPANQAVQASETVTVQAANTLVYATVAELRSRMFPDNPADTSHDAELLDRLVAASRQVDEDCNRVGTGFGQDAVASPRIYKPEHTETLLVDDISTTGGLVVEIGWNTSWTSIDPGSYELYPENSFARGKPANVIKRLYGYWPVWYGPVGYLQQRIRVTALWGWPAVPAQIHDATLLRAHRLFRRKGSPEGVAGWGDLGVVRVSKWDSDYEDLIKDFVLDEM